MPFIQHVSSWPKHLMVSDGLLYHDWDAVDECQRECANRVCATIQLEQEAYLTEHPEILALVKIVMARTIQNGTRNKVQIAARQFVRPYEELDKEVRAYLNVPPNRPYTEGSKVFHYVDTGMVSDVLAIKAKTHPASPVTTTSESSESNATESSSFISIATSEDTPVTAEPSTVPSPTTSEVFYEIISKIVDKATLLHVRDDQFLYDIAYVELTKAVENAMEITVAEIQKDISNLIETSFHWCSIIIGERARIVAERNWEKRMRKKLKRLLRRQDNFKGYETPPTPKSELSSHESYKKPPSQPCKCQPQFHYNRYPKDRFGIYLPRKEKFCNENLTSTPAVSDEDLTLDFKNEKLLMSEHSSQSHRSKSKSSLATVSIAFQEKDNYVRDLRGLIQVCGAKEQDEDYNVSKRRTISKTVLKPDNISLSSKKSIAISLAENKLDRMPAVPLGNTFKKKLSSIELDENAAVTRSIALHKGEVERESSRLAKLKFTKKNNEHHVHLNFVGSANKPGTTEDAKNKLVADNLYFLKLKQSEYVGTTLRPKALIDYKQYKMGEAEGLNTSHRKYVIADTTWARHEIELMKYYFLEMLYQQMNDEMYLIMSGLTKLKKHRTLF